MRLMQNTLTLVAAMIALSTVGLTAPAAQSTVQLGPRPFYLVDQMTEGCAQEQTADMHCRHSDVSASRLLDRASRGGPTIPGAY